MQSMRPTNIAETWLTVENARRLTSFLAAAGVPVSDVGSKYETLQLHEHRIWILPLLHMWTPAFGRPQHMVSRRMFTYYFAHGTDDIGLLGILQLRKMRRSFPEENYPAVGFFCAATNDASEHTWTIMKCWLSSKNEAGVVVVGVAASVEPHRKVQAGGVLAEQEACAVAKVAHNVRKKQWCIHPDVSQVIGLAIVQRAPLHQEE